MTLREHFIRLYGEKAWKRFSPRAKALFERIDAQNAGQKPVSRKLLADALS